MVLMKYIEGSKNYFICSDGRVLRVLGCKGKFLKHGIGTTGYPLVVVTYLDGSVKTKVVHRLVAEYFLDRVEGKNIVNHKDGNKENNHIDNLEWTDYKGNLHHAFENNLNVLRHGELSNFCRLTEEKVREICECLQAGMRDKDIIALTGEDQSVVHQIRRGDTWVRISKEYTFSRTSRRRSISDATARWVCRCLEDGLTPSKILKITTCKELTRGIIKTIQRRAGYHHITRDYTF